MSKIHILHDDPKQTLLERLMQIRNIDDDIDAFLNPTFGQYWIDPFKLKDMDIAIERIIKAIQNKEKIMIFGDYDVDGISSSFTLYTLFTKFLNYELIDIKFPDRINDGYGLKNNHIDDMKNENINLIITVDNGISSIEEANYAKENGIDLIITDHHHAGEIIPEAIAVINPQVSPDYEFKGICGAGVALKLAHALLQRSKLNTTQKKEAREHLIPMVAIATVADVVPLVQENRVLVKKGLEQMNQKKNIPSSLKGMIEFLNLKNIETYHIGFVIGPRINAGGRISSPMDSLNTLLTDGSKQTELLEKLEQINTDRRSMQENAYKIAEKNINPDQKIIIAAHEEFHEGIVGIVAGRLTEKLYRPSVILKIDEEKGSAVGSLRGPDYFSVIDMIRHVEPLLERCGGHRQAGGLSVKLENLEKLKEALITYCESKISEEDMIKVYNIDTKLYPHEREVSTLGSIDRFGPYGEGNPEPIFAIENCIVTSTQRVGNTGKGHLKVSCDMGDKKIKAMFRGKGEELDLFPKDKPITLYGKIKKDTFNGGFFVDGIAI